MAEPVMKQNRTPDQAVHGLAQEEPRWKVIWRRFKKSKTALLGLGILILLILMAIFAPWIAKEPWTHLDLVNKGQPMSADHWFGTDQFGRDLFSRIVWGARISLIIGFFAAFVAVAIGVTYGAVAGYYGGTWLDISMMRVAEAIESIPVLILLVVVSAIISRSVYTVIWVIGLTSWPSLAFLVRGQFLSLRQWDFVQAATALGADDRRIIFRHILPNVMAIIIVNATLRIGSAILYESSLNFLGFGAPPPFPTWGEALATGRSIIRAAPHVTAIPGIFITLTILAFNFVGDGLRDALDPKMKR